MVFQKDLTPLSKGGSVKKHAGKGSKQEVLPSRHALANLTSGSPGARTMNDYAKATPLANPQADNDADDIAGSGSFPGLGG